MCLIKSKNNLTGVTMADNEFTHLGVKKPTHRKTAILATALGLTIYDLVEEWAQREWTEALHEGLVTDAMLGVAAETTPQAGQGVTA